MRMIIFSDIHGNKYAFDKFIEDIKHIDYDYIIFCGDIFGYYYNQEYVIDKLKQIDKLIWLKGNHDDMFVKVCKGLIDEETCISKYGHSYSGLKKKFSAELIEYIDKLPAHFKLNIDNKLIGIFHGTPGAPLDGRLYPNNDIISTDEYDFYDIVILGHTHFKMKRNINNTVIINPGSIGQPRDGKGFGYAVLDINTGEVEFKNIEFNVDELYKEIDLYDPDLSKLKEVLERKEVY